jgi:hypothetical protein
MLKSAAGLAVAVLVPAGAYGSTRDSTLLNTVVVPSEVEMPLSDGRRLKLTRSGDRVWYGQILDRYGRVQSKVASGSFSLKNGAEMKLDRYGRVFFGGVDDRGGASGFLQCIDPPDCGG